jgi:hypothetical protein
MCAVVGFDMYSFYFHLLCGIRKLNSTKLYVFTAQISRRTFYRNMNHVRCNELYVFASKLYIQLAFNVTFINGANRRVTDTKFHKEYGFVCRITVSSQRATAASADFLN